MNVNSAQIANGSMAIVALGTLGELRSWKFAVVLSFRLRRLELASFAVTVVSSHHYRSFCRRCPRDVSIANEEGIWLFRRARLLICQSPIRKKCVLHRHSQFPQELLAMAQTRLFDQLDRSSAIARFGDGQESVEYCGGQWVILPNAVLCFSKLSHIPMRSSWDRRVPHESYLVNCDYFIFAIERPYDAATDEFPFVPVEVRRKAGRNQPVFLFLKDPYGTDYVFAGELNPSNHWGSDTNGDDAYVAMKLRQRMPSAVWARLGGLLMSDLNHAVLDEQLRKLDKASSVDDRLEVVRTWFEYWHPGPNNLISPLSNSDSSPRPQFIDFPGIPYPLQWLYRWADQRHPMMSGCNYLYSRDKLKFDGAGKLRFYSEIQSQLVWATTAEGRDPPVFHLRNGQWRPENKSLSEFMIQVCFDQTSAVAPYCVSTKLEPKRFRSLADPLHRLPFSPSHWPSYPTEFFAGNGLFLMASHTESKGPEILAFARTEYPLMQNGLM